MSVKPKKYRLNRPAKIVLLCLGIFILAVVGVQIWFVSNAKEILKSIVEEKSNGKIRLELSHVSFSILKNRMQIREGSLTSTDTVTTPSTYNVSFRRLTLKVRSFWPLLLRKDLKLDSINIERPVVEAVQWRKDTTAANEEDLSIAEEMGKVYNSMLGVLKNFGIRRILVNNGSLKIVNKMRQDSYPVWITNIHLNVLRKPEDINGQMPEQEMVNLASNNQNIGLPFGRHHLSFKNFKLQLLGKRIDLDSCTITAVPKGNSTSSYTIFFKRLSLAGVDFAAMSKQNLIRADSVYCENPIFNFTILSSPKGKKNSAPPDPGKIIQELTSDLDLAYVGVKNAGIHLNFIGDKPRTISNSNKDNFEIHGLKVKADSTSPVTVDQFDMLVRDYYLYNVDSSAVFSFDSIHFSNSKILLNNFSVITTPSKYKLKSVRDFRFPFFELSGLNWYQLLFNQNVVAREAVLIDPVLTYSKRTRSTSNNVSFFSRLQSLDSLMTIERLNIVNGKLFLNFGQSTSLDLYNVNLKVSSNEFLAAKSQVGIQKAVDYFSMSKGVLKRKDLTGQLLNVTYKPNNLMYADRLILKSTTGNVDAVISDVFLNNMLLDDRTETIYADGVEWKSAVVELRTQAEKRSSGRNTEGSFDVNNISGANTRLILNNGITAINSSVGELRVASLTKANNGAARADGVHFANNTMSLVNDKKDINGSVENIDVDEMLLRNGGKDIMANGIRWNNASLNITDLVTAKQPKQNSGSAQFFAIEGLNTKVNMSNNEGILQTDIDMVKATSVVKSGNTPFTARGLLIKGSNMQMAAQSLTSSVDSYQVAQNAPSYLNNIVWKQNRNEQKIYLHAPVVNFKGDINSLLKANFHFDEVEVVKPEFTITKKSGDSQKDTAQSGKSSLIIDTLTITQPNFSFTTTAGDSTTSLQMEQTDSSVITASHLQADSNGIRMGTLYLSGGTAAYTSANNKVFETTNGKFQATLSNIAINKQDEKTNWEGIINKITLENPVNLLQGTQQNSLVLTEVTAANIALSSANTSDVRKLLASNSEAILQSSTGQFTDSNNTYKWYNAGYDNHSKKLHLDSFKLQPLLPRDSAIAHSKFQTDYITFTTGAVNALGFNLDTFQSSQAIIADTINIDEPLLHIYRDKQPPPGPKQYKPLPTKVLARIKKPVNIQVVNVTNGLVTYTEKTEKSRKEGTLLLAALNGSLKNIKSQDFTLSDSFTVDLNTMLMNKAAMKVGIHESYADTSHAFVFNLQIDPFNMQALNPVMVPLSNVKIKSGEVKALELTAVANNDFATGTMKMHYDDLHIRVVKDGEANKMGLKTKLLTFIANTFFIKNNNRGGSSSIYWERAQEKSFFNYLLKITFNGMGTSVGTTSDRKNKRQYKRKLQELNLPADHLQQSNSN